ncbi:MAG: DedA family protein [Methylococcales symbiont of Hymedesmia sp. n. MRB-2018]|nr:MAG: DedA family protein [Methylococcales symbiont of Hymedesmia sp. n. MRB-2018]KAF3983988.1 MAG: DedA family protein [Methylococcales symbiont of Hymedesmia sp. n. MRB-2018]
MIDEAVGLWGLFFSAFIASTIAPGGSEILLAYMVSEQMFNSEVMVLVATIGNTLGAFTTWFLGVLAAKKFPAEEWLSGKKQKSLYFVRKWGVWSLFFSWLPVVGDGLCFAGGWLKLPFVFSSVIIFVGKAMRYIFVAYIFN